MPNLKETLILTLMISATAQADWARMTIDGLDTEWDSLPVLASDGSSDGFPDLLSVKAARDEWNLVFRLELDDEMLLQQDNSLKLVLDTDSNASTGLSTEGLGAELVWTFGSRNGTAYSASGSGSTVYHDDVQMRHLPSHSSTVFEISLDIEANPLGTPLFPTSTVQAVFYTSGGDRIPNSGSISVNVGAGSLPPLVQGDLDRGVDELRLVSWNVLNDGLTDTGLSTQYQRMLRAMAPDAIVFCELWNTSASQVVSRLNTLVPELGPWSAIKEDSGNVIASRYPIRNSWLIQSGYRETAALIDVSAVTGDSLLLIANHLRCCTADAQRQEEADGLVDFMKDAREPGGRLAINQGTPMVLMGDFNLVGDRQQLVTIETGDIVDNGAYGPDSPPDWDGTSLTDVAPRHPATSEAFTWYSATSSYCGGRLDFALYTDSVIEETGSGVLWTPTLPASLLSDWQLQVNDTPQASDHAPLWFDYRTIGNEPVVLDTPIPVSTYLAASNQVTVSWDPVDGASLYRLEYRASLEAGWFSLVTQPGTTFVFSNPAPDTMGFFRVTAIE